MALNQGGPLLTSLPECATSQAILHLLGNLRHRIEQVATLPPVPGVLERMMEQIRRW